MYTIIVASLHSRVLIMENASKAARPAQCNIVLSDRQMKLCISRALWSILVIEPKRSL